MAVIVQMNMHCQSFFFFTQSKQVTTFLKLCEQVKGKIVLDVNVFKKATSFVLELKKVLHMKPPKTTPTQCFRCQRFGHRTSYCKVEPRCVKWAGAVLKRI